MRKFTGLDYIRIAIANAFGMDKDLWEDRIWWVDNVLPNIPTEAIELNAEETLLMKKAIRAYSDAMAGIPTGFMCHLDATASGLQIIACLTGCKKTAAQVNLINTGKREDVYTNLGDVMNKKCNMNITREIFKHPLMTTFYASTAQPKKIFGDNTPELQAYWDTCHQMLPGGMEYLEVSQGAWNSDALYHQFTLPDGHVAKVLVTEVVEKKITVDELGGATFTHQAEINQCSDYGKSLPANIVQAIDGYIVRMMEEMAEEQGFELLHIFDCFWASPNYMNNVRENYRNILADIADSNLLQDILNELDGTNQKYTKFSDDLGDLIRESEYALS